MKHSASISGMFFLGLGLCLNQFPDLSISDVDLAAHWLHADASSLED